MPDNHGRGACPRRCRHPECEDFATADADSLPEADDDSILAVMGPEPW